MSPTLRKVILKVHRWTGLTVGLVIVMLAVTAAILVFRPLLEPVTSARLFDVGQCTAPVSLDALAANAVEAHPGNRPEDIRIHSGAQEPVQIRFADSELLYVDPCSAKVLGQQNKYGGLFGLPEKLHRFKFIKGEVGAVANGTITLVFALVLVVGGLIVWWPPTLVALRSALRFRPHLRGIALTLNLHNVIGIYTSLILLVATLTALPLSFQWARDAINWITGSQARELKPSSTTVNSAQPVAMESLWQRAQAIVPHPERSGLALSPQTAGGCRDLPGRKRCPAFERPELPLSRRLHGRGAEVHSLRAKLARLQGLFFARSLTHRRARRCVRAALVFPGHGWCSGAGVHRFQQLPAASLPGRRTADAAEAARREHSC